MSSPTINEWPEEERRDYDAYQSELQTLEYERQLEVKQLILEDTSD